MVTELGKQMQDVECSSVEREASLDTHGVMVQDMEEWYKTQGGFQKSTELELVMDYSSVHKLDSSVGISPSPLLQGNSPSTSSHSSASKICVDLMG